MPNPNYDLTAREFIVVGGGGYIGAHVCKRITARGRRQIVFDNIEAGHEDSVKLGPFVKVDLRDRAAILKAFQ